MSIKSITSLFLAVCALSVPMANGDDFYNITENTEASSLPTISATQEYRLMDGSTLLVDESLTFQNPFCSFGNHVTSTIAFSASGSTAANMVLTSLTSTSVWAGYQGLTDDDHTTIQITLDDAGTAALQAAMADGGTYEQVIINASYAGVNECLEHWGKFALTGISGWTIAAEGAVQDVSYVETMQDGEIALIGYDPIYGTGAVNRVVPSAPGAQYDYVSYSQLAIVAKGKPSVTPEPATATLSLLALAGLCARRRRAA